MAEATKQRAGARAGMKERINEALARMESGTDEMPRMERLRMRASVKIMRKSIAMFEKGMATAESARTGLDAFAESSSISRKNYKAVHAAVSAFNRFFETREAKRPEKAASASKRSQRIRKLVAAGALGLALAGTAKLSAQSPGQRYQGQSQQQSSRPSYQNSNAYADPQMQMLARQQDRAIQQLKDAQEKELEDYQKRSDAIIRNLVKEHLAPAQVSAAVNQEMQYLNRMEAYQEQQMSNLLAQQLAERRNLMNQEMMMAREHQAQAAYAQQQQAAILAAQQEYSIRNQVTQAGIGIGMNYLQYQLYRHW